MKEKNGELLWPEVTYKYIVYSEYSLRNDCYITAALYWKGKKRSKGDESNESWLRIYVSGNINRALLGMSESSSADNCKDICAHSNVDLLKCAHAPLFLCYK